MFYVQKVERPVDGNEKETEVVFAAFELKGKAKNRNKKTKGYKSLKDAAKELGITVAEFDYDYQPTEDDLAEAAFEIAFAEAESKRKAKALAKRKEAFRKTYKPA